MMQQVSTPAESSLTTTTSTTCFSCLALACLFSVAYLVVNCCMCSCCSCCMLLLCVHIIRSNARYGTSLSPMFTKGNWPETLEHNPITGLSCCGGWSRHCCCCILPARSKTALQSITWMCTLCCSGTAYEVWHAMQNNSMEVLSEAGVHALAGFAVVFEMMRDSNKPAVGHNLSYDLTFCLASFAQALPPTWSAYKQLVQRWFPAGVWDTKHLARQLQVLHQPPHTFTWSCSYQPPSSHSHGLLPPATTHIHRSNVLS